MLSHAVTCLAIYLYFCSAAEITHYWNDRKLLPPIVNSFNVTSKISCIHRCDIHKNCNAVAVSRYPANGFICLHAWMECYEKYEDRVVSTMGWDVYTFRDQGILLNITCLLGMHFVSLLRRTALELSFWCQSGWMNEIEQLHIPRLYKFIHENLRLVCPVRSYFLKN